VLVGAADGLEDLVAAGDIERQRQQRVAVLLRQVVQRLGVACGRGNAVTARVRRAPIRGRSRGKFR
jgi:hypothetical protein